MKRILFVTSKSLGGSGKYISSLAGALGARGYHCELIYFPLGVSQDREIEASFQNVHHFSRKPGFSPFGVIANILQARAIVANGNFHWVHTHTSLGGLAGRLAARLVSARPNIGHTIHAYGADEFTPRPQKWLYWLIERVLDYMTDAYVSPSRYMMEYGRRSSLITAAKARVIYNALPLKAPASAAVGQRSARRDSLGLRPDQSVLLFCGRLEPQKGMDVLLRALSLLPKDDSWQLLVCGSGDDEDALRRLADSLKLTDRISWLGWQSDLEIFYSASDIYVMPSRWESFGLVFLEAMNHSLPIVSTRVQAIPEVVEEGVTGLLSSSEDTRALADNLLCLMADPDRRRRLGQAGQERLQSLFGFDRFVDEHVRWYEEGAVGRSCHSPILML